MTTFNRPYVHIKDVTLIDPVTGWIEIAQYLGKRAISIANLVETMLLSRYPIPTEITYYQVTEFIGHEFRRRKKRISAKPSTSGNTMSNMILGQIQQVLGNLVRIFNISQTYVDEDDPWTGILAAKVFAIISTINMQNFIFQAN